MENPNVKVNITDNLEYDFKNKEQYIEVNLSKYHFTKEVLREMAILGLSKIFPFLQSKSSFFRRYTKVTETMSINPVTYFKFSLYDSLLKNKKTIDKELNKLMPSILKDISKTIDSYEWNVHVEYKRGFRGDNMLYFLNAVTGHTNEDFYNVYTIINIQSKKYPNVKGELIFDEFMCLYDKSNRVELNDGRKYGTINLFNSFHQYKLNFTDIRNKTYKYKLLLDNENCEINEVTQLNNNFNEFINKYKKHYEPLENFYVLTEASDKLNWRICYSEMYGNVFAGRNEYFSENKLSLENNSESDILRSIVSLMKYMSEIKSPENEKFVLNYEYIDDILENQNLTKTDVEELFETISLLKY